MSGRKSAPKGSLIFLTCLLAIPTLHYILYPSLRAGNAAAYLPHLAVGALLGIAHLLLRPVLRFVSAPIGCITLGLVGSVIDVGLIYLCAHFVEAFQMPSLFFAILSALVINLICRIVGGRKH